MTILDPFGGREDLDARRLRVVDRRTFGDDSLRVLRALQFAARFDLQVDAETRAILRSIPLDDLPAERVWGEVEKLLLQAARPSIGFALARDIGVVERLWPEMHALIGCEQEPEWHPEGDVWIHTLLVIDEARKRLDGLDRGRAAAVMLGAITHDFGKPLTTAFSDGRIRSIGHEEAGVAPATAFLDRLNIHTLDGFDVRTTVLGMVAHHLKPGMFRKSPTPVGDGAFRRLAQKVDLELLARLAEADCNGRTGAFDCSAMAWFLERARALGVEHEAPKPLVLGRHLLDLGVAPGPGMGLILKEIYERQLDGAVTSLDEGLAVARAVLRERARPEVRSELSWKRKLSCAPGAGSSPAIGQHSPLKSPANARCAVRDATPTATPIWAAAWCCASSPTSKVRRWSTASSRSRGGIVRCSSRSSAASRWCGFVSSTRCCRN